MQAFRSFLQVRSIVLRANRFHSKPLCKAFSVSFYLRSLDMDTVPTTERLSQLRNLMKKNQVDVYGV